MASADKSPKRSEHIDPTWPEVPRGEHVVTEFVTDRQGSLSPFGDVEFPLPNTSYRHPKTVINR